MRDKMGDFPAAVATWENRSVSHIIRQAPLLSMQSTFKNTEIYFLTVLEAGKSKIKVWQGSLSGESAFPGLQITALLLYSHMAFPQCVHVEREREISEVSSSSYKATNLSD